MFQRTLNPSQLYEFEDDFYRLLEKVQEETEPIKKDLNVREDFGILQSLRKGVIAHVKNTKVNKDGIAETPIQDRKNHVRCLYRGDPSGATAAIAGLSDEAFEEKLQQMRVAAHKWGVAKIHSLVLRSLCLKSWTLVEKLLQFFS